MATLGNPANSLEASGDLADFVEQKAWVFCIFNFLANFDLPYLLLKDLGSLNIVCLLANSKLFEINI